MWGNSQSIVGITGSLERSTLLELQRSHAFYTGFPQVFHILCVLKTKFKPMFSAKRCALPVFDRPFFQGVQINFFFRKNVCELRFWDEFVAQKPRFHGDRVGFLIGVHRTIESKIREFPEKA